MAQTPSPARSPARSGSSDPTSTEYWCYHCDKRVAVETLADDDVVCFDCKNGFVESIAVQSDSDPSLGNQFIQVLRLIAQAASDDDAPPPPPSDPSNDDYLRIELGGWENDDDDDDDDDDVDDEDEDERSVEVVEEDEENNRSDREDVDDVDVDEEEEENEIDNENGLIEAIDVEEDAERLRRRREVLRVRLRDFATRAASRNRILDWAEIFMGLEDHSIELRFRGLDSDTYVGNPGDYVDAAGYEALLQNLAESDSGGRRGAPPAGKGAVEGLESVVVGKEEEVMGCAICKDLVSVGEVAKNLPCGHGYHGDCIVTWLGSRNSCPVCRFELATDDVEYEEERKKRGVGAGLKSASTSSSGGDAGDSGLQ